MIQMLGSLEPSEQRRLSSRTQQLFCQHQYQVCCRTDRLFLVLMAMQWIGGVVITLVVSPRTWIGATPYLHTHVWAALFLGGAISLAAIGMAFRFPGTTATRHVIAVSQAMWTCLLIHLTGGRIETHFHIFGSLAFLAFYRDWRVLLTASIVVAVDHAVRGTFWPQSVYGVFVQSHFRFLEHVAWLMFLDIFLIISCLRSDREMLQVCDRQAALEMANGEIEERVERRTRELAAAQTRLQDELENHRKTQQDGERLYVDLANASRRAGMAEVATGVLHNVGNVLNSVNVSANVLARKLKNSRVDRLSQASGVIIDQQGKLAEFLTEDLRGKQFPLLLEQLAINLGNERDQMLAELQSLMDNLEHIKEIVSMQQGLARMGGASERVSIKDLIDDAIRINQTGLGRHGVTVECEFEEMPPLISDKHKILQILVNLIGNAKQALSGFAVEDRNIKVWVHSHDDTLQIHVVDNGPGIKKKNLTRIFNHGFTTKQDGHGFGLHCSALAAGELGGRLTAHSLGPGRGATFILELPVHEKLTCLS